MEVEVDWPRAKCRNDAGAPDFYPTGTGGRGSKQDTDSLQEEVAKYCRGSDKQGSKVCPIKDQCLEFALVTREDYGVWGGQTEAGRRYLLKKRRRKNAA